MIVLIHNRVTLMLDLSSLTGSTMMAHKVCMLIGDFGLLSGLWRAPKRISKAVMHLKTQCLLAEAIHIILETISGAQVSITNGILHEDGDVLGLPVHLIPPLDQADIYCCLQARSHVLGSLGPSVGSSTCQLPLVLSDAPNHNPQEQGMVNCGIRDDACLAFFPPRHSNAAMSAPPQMHK